jgi:hypothetical protein
MVFFSISLLPLPSLGLGECDVCCHFILAKWSRRSNNVQAIPDPQRSR